MSGVFMAIGEDKICIRIQFLIFEPTSHEFHNRYSNSNLHLTPMTPLVPLKLKIILYQKIIQSQQSIIPLKFFVQVMELNIQRTRA